MDTIGLLYLSLMICGMFVIMLVISLAASSIWLRSVEGNLRQCPNCKKKGAGEIEEVDVLESETHMDFKGVYPTRKTMERLLDHYQCTHCGHEWTREFSRTKRERVKHQKKSKND